MNIIDLTSELISAYPKIPVFYNHVVVEDGQELPVPYIVTNHETIDSFFADNQSYWIASANSVTLYVAKLSEKYLKMLDKFFGLRSIPFGKSVSFDELTMVYSIVYDIQIDDIPEQEDEEDGNDQT